MTEEMKHIPAVALRGMTILPAMIVHFDISREMSIKAVEQAMLSDQKLFVVTQKDPEVSEPVLDDLYRIGTIVEIKQVIKMPKNILRVLAEGIQRAELVDISDNPEYLDADVLTFVEEDMMDQNTKEALLRSMKETFERYCSVNGKVSKELISQIMELNDLEKATAQIAMNIPLYYEQKQKVLEAVELKERCELLCSIMENEIQILQIKIEIQEKVKERIDKNQREYIMREQMKLIREELKEDNVNEADQFEEELKKLKASKEVKEKIQKEIQRYRNIGMNSGESSVIRGYIETLLEMPWDKASKDSKDIERAREILEADHYGLEKVKERILEFIAVRRLNPDARGQIICLVGPPGVGKTSIALSIAKAMNRKVARLSLGGVRDEADIRGHRKTYIGAMPGRIIEAISRSGSMNPLLVLDEVDKLASDQRGDPASALLEVLDSEQNSAFRDHYLEIPVDLSRVMFLMTANTTETIPRPLLDRMEVIELPSYTDEEKLHIAVDYLLPKQKKANGIAPAALRVDEGALRTVIARYTRESGVRSLERELGRLCRKAAMAFATTDVKRISITAENVEGYLGTPRYTRDEAAKTDLVGVVNGLAWTQVGGEILPVEVGVMDGSGKLELTGNLGEVMQESCKAAMSCLRQRAAELGIPTDFYKTKDIHIHFPEGAVPKDGPSAGIAITTALLSALTDRPVRHDAMTGEVTLRGRVMPIGGLREKTMGALRAGIRTVILPKENEKDLDEIDPNVRAKLRFVPVETVDAVFAEALVYPEAASAARLDTVLPGAAEGGKLPALRV